MIFNHVLPPQFFYTFHRLDDSTLNVCELLGVCHNYHHTKMEQVETFSSVDKVFKPFF